jgi:adenine-specific DNA-methyltransferase
MPTKEELRNRLIEKLKELFQLDRPELDFGLYRIMNAKEEEVLDYLENGLPETLQEAIGNVDTKKVAKFRREYEQKLEEAKAYGAEDPEKADPVREARKKYKAAKESAGTDEKVYDHLYRFFSRYYEKGDFISRRYRVRETDKQAEPYAIPYSGEEVKLHWANADQYYIKTAEHFRNFRFDLRKAVKEADDGSGPELNLGDAEALPVRFRIVEGEEGEHDNVKDSNSKVRKLKPHTPDLLEVTGEGELVVNYEVVFQKSQGEYIYDDEMEERLVGKYGTSVGKSDKEPLAVAETVFEHLGEVEGLDSGYHDLLRYVPPPNNKSTPPLLARYYKRFAGKHEMDYFIHKDLGEFLRRELNFYIKNEVMRLDDIQHAEAPRVESYLNVVKGLRRVAYDIIAFLAQLEDFQKKLWLKKKFVVGTGYCVTLDYVPEDLYETIVENDDQVDEWRELYAVDDWSEDLFDQGGDSFTRAFLENHPHLMVDTRHFDSAFTNRLLAHLGEKTDGGLVEAIDGRCVQGENFQALRLLRERFRTQVDCQYLDPPYNTESNSILYKNNFKHSSWLSMMNDRVRQGKMLSKRDAVHVIAIDEHEQERLGLLLGQIFPSLKKTCVTVIHNPGGTQSGNFKRSNEYAYFLYPSESGSVGLKKRDSEDEWDVRPLRDVSKGDHLREDAQNCFYPILVEDGDVIGFGDVCDDDFHPDSANVVRDDGVLEVYPIDAKGNERKWTFARQTVESIKHELSVKHNSNRDIYDIIRTKKSFNPKTTWTGKKYNSNIYGSKVLNNMFGESRFDFPKSIHNVIDCLKVATKRDPSALILDPFAGSATTGHAVMKMNRDPELDGDQRKYILIEMGDYFDTASLPRLKKAAFSDKWTDGVPERLNGQSHVIKYNRLESYEDTLNNLNISQDKDQQRAIDQNEDLRRDYRLHYMLDVETEGSPSLLDIDEFTDPRQYHLQVKKPGSDASTQTSVDLLETFNYLLGLRVEQINMPRTFTADFHRPEDPELPEDERTRLEIDGEMEPDEDGDWWFRTVTGWVPSDPMNPDDSDQERILVIWRTLTDDREQDNAMLNAYVEGQRDDLPDADRVYVNGSNNLASLRREDEDWEVHLLEKEFMERMWDVQDV